MIPIRIVSSSMAPPERTILEAFDLNIVPRVGEFIDGKKASYRVVAVRHKLAMVYGKVTPHPVVEYIEVQCVVYPSLTSQEHLV